jgi:hypothetical protein
MNNEWFVIKNLDSFILSTRTLLYNNFGKDGTGDILKEISDTEREEFDTILTQEESLLIAKPLLKKQTNKTTKETRYLVTDDIYMEIIEKMNDRMVSNILNSLVNKGFIETAYDDTCDDFVFWIKEKDEEKPETD